MSRAEAASGEAPEERRRDGLALDQPSGPVALGLERGDGIRSCVRLDLAPPEVGPDGRVPIAATRKQLGTALRQPGVVEGPGAGKSRDRLLAGGRGVSRPREALVESPLGAVAGRKRSRGRGERLGAPDFARQLTRSEPVERAADCEAGPYDRGRRQDTPRPAVELDRNPAALPLAQPRDDRGHASASAVASASAATSALPLLFSTSSTATGSSRADAIWSEPSSAWICCRIPCVTSGCSRRKAVAF